MSCTSSPLRTAKPRLSTGKTPARTMARRTAVRHLRQIEAIRVTHPPHTSIPPITPSQAVGSSQRTTRRCSRGTWQALQAGPHPYSEVTRAVLETKGFPILAPTPTELLLETAPYRLITQATRRSRGFTPPAGRRPTP